MTKPTKQIGGIDGKTPETQHTPEPWRYVDESTPAEVKMGLPNYAIESADGGFDIASLLGNEADARRIVAAINACKGISTVALEQGAIGELREVAELFVQHFGIHTFGFHEVAEKAEAVVTKISGRKKAYQLLTGIPFTDPEAE